MDKKQGKRLTIQGLEAIVDGFRTRKVDGICDTFWEWLDREQRTSGRGDMVDCMELMREAMDSTVEGFEWYSGYSGYPIAGPDEYGLRGPNDRWTGIYLQRRLELLDAMITHLNNV